MGMDQVVLVQAVGLQSMKESGGGHELRDAGRVEAVVDGEALGCGGIDGSLLAPGAGADSIVKSAVADALVSKLTVCEAGGE